MRIEGPVVAGIASRGAFAPASFLGEMLGVESVQEDGCVRFLFPNGSPLAVAPPDRV